MPERITHERLVAVQAEHAIEFLHDGEWVGCSCGDECPQAHAPEEWADWHRAHLADVLLALAAGPLAAAWDEGYSHLFGSECTDVDPVSLRDNPYRAEQEAGR